MSVSIIQQTITAGGNFGGVLPPGSATPDKDVNRFAPAATGGRFDFSISGPHEISAIEIKLANQSSWSISKKDSDGDLVVLFSGTTETSFVMKASERSLLYEGEVLELVTAAATTAMKCRVAINRMK